MNKSKKLKILIIENEKRWQEELSKLLSDYCPCNIKVIGKFEEADHYISISDLQDYKAIVIDVRIREQIYDQGGLALLDVIREKNKTIPILVLTAYAFDYPSLRDVTKRYSSVYAYEKDIFKINSKNILDILLANLPPQIGDIPPIPYKKIPLGIMGSSRIIDKDLNLTMKIIFIGIISIIFILLATLLFLVVLKAYPNNSWQLNIIFSVILLVILSVIIKIFNFSIVNQAIGILKRIIRNF